jgi:hypothetical protein
MCSDGRLGPRALALLWPQAPDHIHRERSTAEAAVATQKRRSLKPR